MKPPQQGLGYTPQPGARLLSHGGHKASPDQDYGSLRGSGTLSPWFQGAAKGRSSAHALFFSLTKTRVISLPRELGMKPGLLK